MAALHIFRSSFLTYHSSTIHFPRFLFGFDALKENVMLRFGTSYFQHWGGGGEGVEVMRFAEINDRLSRVLHVFFFT